jgi:HPt (histidine-containing phosphotransfer) domain-containing protein
MSDAEIAILDTAAFETLSELMGGESDLIAEIIDVFFDEAPTILDEMRSSFSDRNATDLRRSAHSLKTNSATFGATVLHDLCRRLEELGKAGDFDGAGELVEQCVAEYARVERALSVMRPDA